MRQIIVLHFIKNLTADIQSKLELLQLIHDFWTVTTPLDHLSIYFPLFRLEKCIHGIIVNALNSRPSAEDRRTSLVKKDI